MSLRRQVTSYLAVLLTAACGGSDDSPAPGLPQPPPTLNVARVFPALSFALPIAMLQAPGDASRWFVVEQGGRVRVFANNASVATDDTFADLTDRVRSGGEKGLLGMAFHPNFPGNPRVYFNYTHQDAVLGLVTRISEFMVDANGRVGTPPAPGSERVLLTIAQPEENHNGGHLAFGRDGFLYIGMGDGGGGNDDHPPFGNGQRMTTLLGKMLRIDVRPTSGYDIPSDNPFAGNATCHSSGNAPGTDPCPEIYASGFRNPWRWSFDREDGRTLWLGDVGQGAWEEIDRVTREGNYGWRCFEATQGTNLDCPVPLPTFTPPVAEYTRGAGAAVTGGYVYRGSAIPGLVGRYVFADFIQRQLWHIAADTQPTLRMGAGLQIGLNISSFAEDVAGELYVVDYGGGLYRLTAAN